MGEGKWNIYPQSHISGGDWEDHKVRVHRGDCSVDTVSPVLGSYDDYCDLKSAASTSQAAFDSAVSSIGGGFATWYSALPTEAKTATREGYALL